MKPVGAAVIRTPDYNQSLPERTVRVAGFLIDPTEVTESRYAEFLAATGYFPPASWDNRVASRKSSRLPVADVSFVDAMFYCAWRKARLPTWAEWHRAAFGPAGRAEPWGENPADGAFERDENLSNVGSHPKSGGPHELADIIGNAWEWCGSPLVHVGRGDREFADPQRAVILGGGEIRVSGSERKSGLMDTFVTIVSAADSKLEVFWDARERLPYAGHNQTVWGASVISEDFLCVAQGSGTIWMGTPDDDARRYPRLCVAAGGFALRSPTIGFRCAATEVGSP